MAGNIEKFELTINEKIYVEGELLFDKGGVISIAKGENNLYTSEINDDGNMFEVEILNPASLHRKTTCDCETYKNQKLCKHIVATLLAIRKKLSKPKSKRKLKKKEETKFTTKSLLNLIESRELKSFVQDYARKDKRFELFFKARFSKKMELEDNTLKYKSILDSLIPLAKNSEQRINKTSIVQINKFFNEFYSQIEDSLVLQQYSEAFDIFAPVFKKIAYVRHFTRVEDTALVEIDSIFHKLLKRMFYSKAAPELHDQIKLFSLSLASFSYYQIRDFNYNILMIIYEHDFSALTDIQSIMVDHLSRYKTPLILSLYIFFNKNDLKNLNLTEYYNNQQLLVKSLQILVSHGHENIAKELLDKIDLLKWKNSSFDELRLAILEKEKNYVGLIKYAMNKLVSTNHFYYFKLMDNAIPLNKKELLNKAIENNKHLLTSDLLCHIYLAISDDRKLMDSIKIKEDVFLALKYDSSLFDSYPEEISTFYLESVEKYLVDHVGYEANKYVNNIIEHIVNKGNKVLAKKIKNLIINKFPHRKRFLSSYQ